MSCIRKVLKYKAEVVKDVISSSGSFKHTIGCGGSSSGSASDYGSKGRKFDSRCRWELGFFLSSISIALSLSLSLSSPSYHSISGAS